MLYHKNFFVRQFAGETYLIFAYRMSLTKQNPVVRMIFIKIFISGEFNEGFDLRQDSECICQKVDRVR